MLSQIRRWFSRRERVTTPAAIDAPATGTDDGAPASASAREALAAVAAPGTDPLVLASREQLMALLLERIDRVTNTLTDEHRTQSDALALLSTLRGNDEWRIRQLPAAAQEALALCDDPDVDAARIVSLFQKDPTLAQALLQEANSAYYRTGAAVVSLRDAVERVGVSGVRNVLLASVVKGLLCRPGSAYAELVEQVWSHMVRTAPLARRLAPAFSADPDQAFALGLLHDVGKLIIFDAAASMRVASRRTARLPARFLRGALLELHEPLGGLAALRWGLGPYGAQSIATHHRNPPPAYRDVLSETLFLAERGDLAAVRSETIDLDALWSTAQLTGSAVRAAEVLEQVAAERAAA